MSQRASTARDGIARRLETALAWTLVAGVGAALLLGGIGPRLGDAPGPSGLVGFAIEIAAALWLPLGWLAAAAAAVAAVRRLRRPACGLLALALLVVPALWDRLRAPRHGRGDAPALRVASVNLQAENTDDPRMHAALRALDADVLVLIEFTVSWQERLTSWFTDGEYPHRFLAAPPPQDGLVTDGLRIAVWSRLAASGPPETLVLNGVNAQIRVPFRWQGRELTVYGVHPWKPFPYGVFRTAWRDRQRLLAWLGSESSALVLAGDLNAAPGSPFVRRLRARGLTSAGESVRGIAPGTWPARPTWLVPLRFAIDHVLHGDALDAVDFGTGDPAATGSDHLAVWADLVWRSP